MAEYIEREAAKERFKRIAIVGTDYIMQRLDDVPAADVVEVRRGAWEKEVDEYEICATVFICNKCKEEFCTGEMTDEQFLACMNYCPNCGALMNGKATDK